MLTRPLRAGRGSGMAIESSGCASRVSFVNCALPNSKPLPTRGFRTVNIQQRRIRSGFERCFVYVRTKGVLVVFHLKSYRGPAARGAVHSWRSVSEDHETRLFPDGKIVCSSHSPSLTCRKGLDANNWESTNCDCLCICDWR